MLILNDKYDVVARHHLVYNVGNVERYRHWAVLTIEKNRSGVTGVDLEFPKRFDQSRFEPHGQLAQRDGRSDRERLKESTRQFHGLTSLCRPAVIGGTVDGIKPGQRVPPCRAR